MAQGSDTRLENIFQPKICNFYAISLNRFRHFRKISTINVLLGSKLGSIWIKNDPFLTDNNPFLPENVHFYHKTPLFSMKAPNCGVFESKKVTFGEKRTF